RSHGDHIPDSGRSGNHGGRHPDRARAGHPGPSLQYLDDFHDTHYVGLHSDLGGAMKQIQAPEFLNNLYRDMRDRRLLLPAAALLVCLIAIPQLLSSSSTPAPAAPTVPVTTAGKQTAAEPAV